MAEGRKVGCPTWWLAGTLALILACSSATAADAPAPMPLAAAELTVVDGDSVAIEGQEWRLIGLDAPETARANCEGERRAGLFAARRLAALIGSGAAIVMHPTGTRDRHRRPLGRLEIGGADVAATLIEEGYARPYNGGRRKGWCSRDSRDDLVPGLPPAKKRGAAPIGPS